MQSVAQALLVLQLTKSAALLGFIVALQFLPVFALAPYGGLIADRFSKRRLLLMTQTIAAVLALALGTLVVTGLVRLWMIALFALALGVINALDNPTRQAFLHEMVGPDTLRNAVTLNSILINVTRIVGPAIAGVLAAWLASQHLNLGPLFIINGLSFVAVLVCLALMRASELHRTERAPSVPGQLREGFRYVLSSKVLRDVLLIMAIVGTLTYEFPVTLPALAQFTFHDPTTFAWLMTAMGAGAVAGGLIVARRREATLSGLAMASLGFGASLLLVSIAPTIVLAALAMVIVGGFSTPFTSLTNAILQMESGPTMRGRVLSLWTVAFLGSTVFGAPIVGLVAHYANPRWALVVGAAAALGAGAFGVLASRGVGSRAVVPALEIEDPPVAEKEDYVP